MKTLRNLSIVKSISSVLFVAFVISLSISAQENFNQVPFEEYEITVEDWMTDIESYNSDEESIEIEDWMTNIESFSVESDELLVLEDWMSDLSSFNTDEQAMEVELWMTSLDEFYNGYDAYLLATSDEEPMVVENWMTDLQEFNKVRANEIEGIKDIEFDTHHPLLIALKN